MGKVMINDQITERSEAVIDIEDRGYQFGDGVYEVIRIYEGILFTAGEHLNRFYQSAEKIKMFVPFEKEQLRALVQQLVKENQVKDGSVYMQLTRGAAPRNHVFPGRDIQPVLTAYTKELPRPEEAMTKGVKVIVVDDIRWLRCDIKSLNLLPNILAKQEASEQGCFEAIQHRNGLVTEGSSSNVYIIKDGNIKTHPATNLILNGITRQVIAQLCAENDIPFLEEPFHVEELFHADEVFISSTTSEVMPVIQIDKQVIGDGKPGRITSQLQSLFVAKIESDKHNK